MESFTLRETRGGSLYAGFIFSENYGISWLKGQHEPLIWMTVFEKVQERRAGNAKAPKRKNIGKDFALRGFVCCDDCGVPLRSSWVKGNTKLYPYYLCQKKTCRSCGKSIARDRIEGDVGALIKELQPTKDLFALTSALFHVAWDARSQQAREAIQSGKRQIHEVEAQIETLLSRILGTENAAIIGT